MITHPHDDIARVLANYGTELTIATAQNQRLTASPLKKLGLVVTGDLVRWQAQPHGNAKVIEVLERRGTLERTDRNGTAKPIASHVSQLLALTAPKPPFDTLLIDRYCIAAQNIGASLVVIINKQDLLTDNTAGTADDVETLYGGIGYPVTRCSVSEKQGLDDIHTLLEGHVSIMVGQSGVGKSSLLNALLPDQETKTGALSDNSGLGRHTTTVTNWYDLPNNGAIIDSPGVRQFSLEHLAEVDIQAGFREISSLAANCKFNDCSHVHEPHCAVLQALEQEQIGKERYAHFVQLTNAGESSD